MNSLTYIILFTLLYATTTQSTRFQEIRQWKYVNFTWPDEDTLKTATAKGAYVPENNVIAGVKYFEDYYYITLPRMKSGVPATLTRIPAGPTENNSPNLEPFPSWQMNSVDDCNSLQNVQNVEIDTKGQIWIIDGGRIETLMRPIVKCQPKLLIFDIKNNRTSTVFQFPEEIAAKNGSFLYDIVVDDTDGGFAYITDNSANDPGIIVYSVKENRSWKIRHARSMQADPSASHFQVNGISISAPINIAGIALGPKIRTSDQGIVVNEDREVYFCPLSSLHLYSINTTTLRNENKANSGNNYDNEIKDIGLKASQTVGMIMDNQGILYYSLLGNNGISKWDTHTSFQSNQKLIAKDDKYIEWPNSFTFDLSGNLTVVMNRLNKFIFAKLDLNEPNFRLLSAKVDSKSYLYDDHFQYDSVTGEPKPEPQPEPQPEPKAEPQPETKPQPHADHDNHMTPQQSTASTLVLNLLCLIVGSALFFT